MTNKESRPPQGRTSLSAQPEVLKAERLEVRAGPEVDAARRAVQAFATELGMAESEQDMIATATSELARNMLDYGGGGWVLIEALQDARGQGLRVSFEDQGPGIADIAQAMEDGYSSGSGMGLGLPGARRLVHDFEIESASGCGTRIVIARWMSP